MLNSVVSDLVIDKKVVGIEVTDKLGNTETIDIDGLFIAVGRIPENKSFSELIELDGEGYAVAGEDCVTKAKGIFVAGDNRTKDVRQLVTAASDGAIAATQAVKYINSL